MGQQSSALLQARGHRPADRSSAVTPAHAPVLPCDVPGGLNEYRTTIYSRALAASHQGET
eukprot:scaffold175939_cov27-Tisochrysis_lutea.AAC.4